MGRLFKESQEWQQGDHMIVRVTNSALGELAVFGFFVSPDNHLLFTGVPLVCSSLIYAVGRHMRRKEESILDDLIHRAMDYPAAG